MDTTRFRTGGRDGSRGSGVVGGGRTPRVTDVVSLKKTPMSPLLLVSVRGGPIRRGPVRSHTCVTGCYPDLRPRGVVRCESPSERVGERSELSSVVRSSLSSPLRVPRPSREAPSGEGEWRVVPGRPSVPSRSSAGHTGVEPPRPHNEETVGTTGPTLQCRVPKTSPKTLTRTKGPDTQTTQLVEEAPVVFLVTPY